MRSTQHWAERAKADVGSPCFWLRGLPPKSKYPQIPPPPEEEEAYQVGNPDEDFFRESVFYLDGSGGSRSSDKRLRRCGWAAITTDFSEPAAPELKAGFFGKLAGQEQTVPRSELYAAVFVLEQTEEREVKLLSDSKYFVDLIKARRSKSIAGSNADLWERYWQAFDWKMGK